MRPAWAAPFPVDTCFRRDHHRYHVPVSVPLVEKFTAKPVGLATARLPADKGGVPPESGFYAWWLTDEMALPSVPTSVHPTQPVLGLVYIGIAPKNTKSPETIRSRILNKHLGNAVGRSTLRRGLAAFLWEDKDWHPYATSSNRPALPPEECATLTRWIEAYLRVLVSRRTTERPRQGVAVAATATAALRTSAPR